MHRITGVGVRAGRSWTGSGRLRAAVSAGLLALLCAGCTSVGSHTRVRQTLGYGPPVQMRVCVLRADGVSTGRVQQLIDAANAELGNYGIEVVVPWVRDWQRPGFRHEAIMADLTSRELEAPCDRLVAFVDRNGGDFLWGLALPEVLGSVDDATHTRGYVVANRASLNQLLMSPKKVAVHEFYHLLGCPHAVALSGCYERIARLKRHATAGFLPGIGSNGSLLLTREEANRVTGVALAAE